MTRADEFRALHDDFLLLPNAWDVASAAALAGAGFAAVGTTSLGVAAGAGLTDGVALSRTETVALATRLAGLPVPVTVDVEGGFSDDPGAVRDLGHELAAMGIAGVNLEDGRENRGLADPAHHARLVAAMGESGLFVNARTDTHWLDIERDSTLDRVRAYVDAGADGVFVPGVVADAEVEALVAAAGVPVNLLFQPGRLSIETVRALGVRRVSTGSLLFRAALGAALETAGAVRDGVPLLREVPTVRQIQGL
ncbi:isocitrate lyase/PEP mutase family protein [Actinophytocola algeriensis]|uniref:2-methylisocitrate lyase-like PEP mutase family enzyme n=1 Tax=Actinophytocola algeriensis TaxID=1768010 RepID=A0A7W7Q6R1_9PSEU|nr:isocitrate lyase/phosphoenolpyruvate mutase family protein [Actinophytocola algeriensis]MBB4907853.1 2-methylisocitrate lyase-like PEP mutase family enzyme [Actinophytocola algeriensis]MBE1479883.1 2-methylisocitrate lyase-like PEP mutase family enzyme [Actinophytocola algeriensis]